MNGRDARKERVMRNTTMTMAEARAEMARRGWSPIMGAEDPPDPDPKPDPAPGGDDDTAKLQSALKSEREARKAAEKESKAQAKRLEELEEKARKVEEAEKTELEKAQGRIAELEGKEAETTEKVRRANLLAELSKPEHGLQSASAAAKLVEVEFDEDDNPVDVGDAVKTLLEEVPGLAATPADPGKPNPANPAKKKNDQVTREDIAQLAKDDPKKFNEMFEAGEIPASALGA